MSRSLPLVSRSAASLVNAVCRRCDHCVALGIDRDDGDRNPVARVAHPAPRTSCPCLLVERMASPQDGVILADMLNTIVSTVQKWEIGENRPSGPSLKLLNLIQRKGIQALS